MAMPTLTALFTSRDGAVAAASDLRRRGLSSNVTLSPEVPASPRRDHGGEPTEPRSISRDGSAGSGGTTQALPPSPGREAGAFWAWLDMLVDGPADREAYGEALGRGETVLTAVVSEMRVDETLGLLDHRHGATRVDRWRPSWRDGRGAGARPAGDASLTRMAQDLAAMPSGTPASPGDRLSQGQSRTWKARLGMAVVGSDGIHVGVVDGIGRDAVVLAAEGLRGSRHSLPEDWIGTVDSRVTLRLAGPDARRCWVDVD